ncbi:hypothetical protein M409DRAFT_61563 [Zasmidium cellare ATCC 36951]|uniref:Uncharacterized protein n=1 Tax=Zasmidium cellare ATCC 36951 TaxID=1080233 RepID=A0A6A6BUY6_ZASCE|nr:uncharacterized protein M409DRAFT_61563 [Zasmidium cellare ATCC 36951]KAF2158551.1 hypothetical protein M409DRAFT_61563 [Zasmidium cellare ATCC 36951]
MVQVSPVHLSSSVHHSDAILDAVLANDHYGKCASLALILHPARKIATTRRMASNSGTTSRRSTQRNGRGGFGNIRPTSSVKPHPGRGSEPPFQEVNTLSTILPKRPGLSGSGEFENVTAHSEVLIFQFDEDVDLKRGDIAAPVYRLGRGGMGNVPPSKSLQALQNAQQ